MTPPNADESVTDPTFVLLVNLESVDLSKHGPLDDPLSTAAQIARRRRQGTLVAQRPNGDIVDIHDTDDIPDQYVAIGELFDPDREELLNPDSGIGMIFVTPDQRDLPPADLKTIQTVYPCPTQTYNSLPVHIQNLTSEQDFVRLRCDEYDADSQLFKNPHLGWDTETIEPLSHLLNVARETSTNQAAIDYVTFLYGPQKLQDIDALAEKREVEPDTIAQNIRDVAEELSDSDLPDENLQV